MTEIVADKTVEVVKNAIETADGALDLYNKYLDQVIPWQTFDETIKELGSDSNLLIVLYVQIMPDDLVMQLHRF